MLNLLNALLRTNAETEILEFKTAEQGFDKNKLGQYFSALSNEANLANKECAWLIFGINDKHKVFGTKITDRTLNEYKQEIASNTSPTSNFINTHRVNVEGKQVLMLQIPPAPKGMPVDWKGPSIFSVGFLTLNCFLASLIAPTKRSSIVACSTTFSLQSDT
jgi:ATP-dependent DNA helicase RecG